MKVIYEKFLLMADEKKDIVDDDLFLLMEGEVKENKIEMEYVQVLCGNPLQPLATVDLNVNGQTIRRSADGNGPVNAAYRAVDKIIGQKPVVEEYLVQSMNGSGDSGKVHVRVELNGKCYQGFGVNEDIVVASVKAYVNCLLYTSPSPRD